MKKLTEANRKRIKEYFVKKYNINEGFIEWLFGKALVRRLENDPEFVAKAKELDKSLKDYDEMVAWARSPKGTPIPDHVKSNFKNLFKPR